MGHFFAPERLFKPVIAQATQLRFLSERAGSQFFPQPLTPQEGNNIWKEMGLNPGLPQLVTALPSTRPSTRHLSLEVKYVEFDFDVKFLTLMYPLVKT